MVALQQWGIVGSAALAGLALVSGIFWARRKRRTPRGKTVRVRKVLDGDTVIVSTGLRTLTLRLGSIDCPENGQPWGDTAKWGLVKLIGGKRVRTQIHSRDIHGRYIATLWVSRSGGREWTNVNARMVLLGHAWVYHRYTDHLSLKDYQELVRMERWAMRKRVGLWRTNNPIPPWVWRKPSS